MTSRLIIERRDLHAACWAEMPEPALAEGEVRLRVDSFALTANNITYAVFGETMRYWDFFPTGDPASGCLPVWGFGDVAESRCADIAVGERLYGFLPAGDELVLTPARVSRGGFFDASAHRRDLPAVYNQLVRCAGDRGHDPAHEAEQALLRPLFMTSLLIDDFIAEHGGFGAQQVLLSSASSKTAYGTAFCLSHRRGTPQSLHIVGLTSPAHVDFCASLGCYDEVLAYEQLDRLDAQRPSVYVDFSGSAPLRRAVHGHFGDRLKHSASVGGAHWNELGAKGASRDLPGPPPTLFFAPAQVDKRLADWGPAGLQQRMAAAWQDFMQALTNAQAPWLTVQRGRGPQAIVATYLDLLAGRADPRVGHLLTLR